MILNQKIQIQKLNDDNDSYSNYYSCHAQVNKTGGNEYLIAGAVSTKNKFTFIVRYCEELKNLQFDTQTYRIVFNGVIFNILDADDFMQRHKTIKIIGESINGQ